MNNIEHIASLHPLGRGDIESDKTQEGSDVEYAKISELKKKQHIHVAKSMNTHSPLDSSKLNIHMIIFLIVYIQIKELFSFIEQLIN